MDNDRCAARGPDVDRPLGASRPPRIISSVAESKDQPPGTTCGMPSASTVAIRASAWGGFASHRRSSGESFERATSGPCSGSGPADDEAPDRSGDHVLQTGQGGLAQAAGSDQASDAGVGPSDAATAAWSVADSVASTSAGADGGCCRLLIR